MKIRDMELLVRVAETGSMTLAAQQLHVTPAAVSAAVQRIEEAIGVRIFQRTTRSLTVTDEGVRVIDGCLDVVARWQRTVEAARERRTGVAGTIHLSAPADTTYQILESIVVAVCAEHPALRVVLDTSDVVKHLHGGAIDMAIRYGPLQDSTLLARKLAECPAILVASRAYLAEAGTPDRPQALSGHRCLTLQLSGEPTVRWELNGNGESHALTLDSALCGDGYLARRWAISGMGIAFKSLFDVIDDLENGRLVHVLPEYAGRPMAIHAVFSEPAVSTGARPRPRRRDHHPVRRTHRALPRVDARLGSPRWLMWRQSRWCVQISTIVSASKTSVLETRRRGRPSRASPRGVLTESPRVAHVASKPVHHGGDHGANAGDHEPPGQVAHESGRVTMSTTAAANRSRRCRPRTKKFAASVTVASGMCLRSEWAPKPSKGDPMSQLSSTKAVRAPLTRVWETIADVGTIAAWHPGVERSPVLSDHRTGLGAVRRVELYDGTSAVEEVTSLDEGRSLTVTMSEFSMPLSRGAATFEVEADGDERTLVTMTMDYEMKYGPLGWLINAVMLRPIIGKLLASVLSGLDHHLVTGDHIGQNGVTAST